MSMVNKMMLGPYAFFTPAVCSAISKCMEVDDTYYEKAGSLISMIETV